MKPSSSGFPPDGFGLHDRHSPVTEPWEPIYSRVVGVQIRLGLIADLPHTNSRGQVHGGLIAALADNAMGLSCRNAGGGPQLVTVTLSVDYLEAAYKGDWLEFQPSVTRIGRLLSFATALIISNDRLCGQARGTYRTIKVASGGEGAT